MPQTGIKVLAGMVGRGDVLSERQLQDWVGHHVRMRNLSEQMQVGNLQIRSFSADHGFFATLPHEVLVLRNDTNQATVNNVDLLLTFDEDDSFTKEFGLEYEPKTNPTKAIIRGTPGESVFNIMMWTYWDPSGSGSRRNGIRINGGAWGAMAQINESSGNTTIVSSSFTRILVSHADELEFSGFQNSGGGLNMYSAHVGIFRVR